MDDLDGIIAWNQASSKSAPLLNLLRQFPLFSSQPAASLNAVTRGPPGLRQFLSGVLDRIHSPWIIGGGIALVAATSAGAWIFSRISEANNAQASHVSQVEAENARLLVEIDRLTHENVTLQENGDRASTLNAEVQALLQAMQSADLPPEQMQGQLRLLMDNLIEMVRRQSAQLQARNDELLNQTRVLREEALCKVCFEYPVARSFNPCGHGTCVKCASRLNQAPCPFCRKEVESIIPRY